MRRERWSSLAYLALALVFLALGHAYFALAVAWAFVFVTSEFTAVTKGRRAKAVTAKEEGSDPVPDDLSGYVPAGQAELSATLREYMASQVEEAADRWNALRDPLPNYRWQMNAEWHAEVKKLKDGPGDRVTVGEEYGVPELVRVKASQKTVVPPENRAVKMLDDAITAARGSRDTAAARSQRAEQLRVLPQDLELAASLLDKHAGLWAAMQDCLNTRPSDGGYLARHTGFDALEAELAAVDKRLKELYRRYDTVKALDRASKGMLEWQNRAILRAYGVPDGSHCCNGKYCQNIRHCPEHGK